MKTFLIFFLLVCLCLENGWMLEPEERRDTRDESIIQLCGFRYENDEHEVVFNRIVGGENAKKKEFKWQVSMRLKQGNKYHHVCGGTIIGKSWVLTAAHCTVDFTKKLITVVAGEYSLSKNDVSEQTRDVELIIEHEDYDYITQENDIALIKTTKPFNFGSMNVAPACLPDPKQTFTESCVVSGWGKRKEGGSNSNILQKVWLPILSDDVCRNRMKKIGYDGLVQTSMLCAGVTGGGKDACQGDSGGPLVCPGTGNMPVLAGVVSWGIGCARKNIPGVYTEVSHFVGWINKKVSARKDFRLRMIEETPEETLHGDKNTRYFDYNPASFQDQRHVEQLPIEQPQNFWLGPYGTFIRIKPQKVWARKDLSESVEEDDEDSGSDEDSSER